MPSRGLTQHTMNLIEAIALPIDSPINLKSNKTHRNHEKLTIYQNPNTIYTI